MDISKYEKAYCLLICLCKMNEEFRKIFDDNILSKKIRFFDEEEWSKIKKQNFISPIKEMNTFEDLFILGYNIGNCVGTSWQLSFSYSNVDIVSGVLPMLKGTLNAEKEGGHCWLETNKYIIDTSLMLIVDKSLKDEIGYIEEQRITYSQLLSSRNYRVRKEFVNDTSFKKNK